MKAIQEAIVVSFFQDTRRRNEGSQETFSTPQYNRRRWSNFGTPLHLQFAVGKRIMQEEAQNQLILNEGKSWVQLLSGQYSTTYADSATQQRIHQILERYDLAVAAIQKINYIPHHSITSHPR